MNRDSDLEFRRHLNNKPHTQFEQISQYIMKLSLGIENGSNETVKT